MQFAQKYSQVLINRKEPDQNFYRKVNWVLRISSVHFFLYHGEVVNIAARETLVG